MAAFGCRGSLSPLSNRLQIGQEPYVVFAAAGEEGVGDLFASSTAGGAVFQVTFTRVDERLPALSPSGILLAFVRAAAPGTQARASLVVMNLLNGAERRVELEGKSIDAVAWSADGNHLFIRGADGIEVTAAPPAPLALTPVPTAQLAAADSLFRILLGDPPQAEAVPCAGAGLCARFADGHEQPITPTGSSPVRWPGDSLLYREGERWVVRPLGGGKSRDLVWQKSLGQLRSLTVFGGPAQRTE
jgi:hypothetical protein